MKTYYEDSEIPYRKKKILGKHKLQWKYPALSEWKTWNHYQTEEAAEEALKVLQGKNAWAEYRMPPA